MHDATDAPLRQPDRPERSGPVHARLPTPPTTTGVTAHGTFYATFSPSSSSSSLSSVAAAAEPLPPPPDGGRWFYSKVTENPTPRSSRDPRRGRLIARRPYKRVRSLAIITRNGHDRLRFFFFVSSWVLPSRQSRFFHGTITRKSILRREDREIVHSRTYLRKRKFILDHTRSIPLDLTRKLYNMAQPGFI